MIRKYSNKDKSKIIELLRFNTPAFFDPSEEKELEHYLEREIEDYFIVEEDAKIVGSGGINHFPKDKTVRFSWDMIHPDFQGKGIGRKITDYRIGYVQENPAINTIEVRTTQLVFKFYEKMGFQLVKIEKDYWAKGFHLYHMKQKIGS